MCFRDTPKQNKDIAKRTYGLSHVFSEVTDMKLIQITECPFCGGSKFTDAKARYVSPIDDGFHGSVLFHTICLECGSVVRSYIKDTAPFISDKK